MKTDRQHDVHVGAKNLSYYKFKIDIRLLIRVVPQKKKYEIHCHSLQYHVLLKGVCPILDTVGLSFVRRRVWMWDGILDGGWWMVRFEILKKQELKTKKRSTTYKVS